MKSMVSLVFAVAVGFAHAESYEVLMTQEYGTLVAIEENGQLTIKAASASGPMFIPENCVCIADYAFKGCADLVSLMSCQGLRSVGVSSFEGCSGLMFLSLMSCVTNIGQCAFSGCSKLKTIIVEKGDADRIKTLLLKSGMDLTDVAFCEGTCAVTFESTGGSLPRHALIVGKGVPIGFLPNPYRQGYSFEGWYDSREDGVKISPSTVIEKDMVLFAHWKLMEGDDVGTFNGIRYRFHVANGEAAITGVCDILEGAVTLPFEYAGWPVTKIDVSAFEGCDEMSSVIIPSNVVCIGGAAFKGCTCLKDVFFTGVNPPRMGGDVFAYCHGDLVAHVSDNWNARTKVIGGVNIECIKEQNRNLSVCLVVTNVAVNYVLNSVSPEFCAPPTLESGFVAVVAEVKGGFSVIPETWAANYSSFVSRFGSDFPLALSKKTGKKDAAGNDMFVWQDYVAGTDPTNPEDKFNASISIVDDKVKIAYTPELDDERKAMRKYVIWGKKSILDQNWIVVPEDGVLEYNFFKVTVEMR